MTKIVSFIDASGKHVFAHPLMPYYLQVQQVEHTLLDAFHVKARLFYHRQHASEQERLRAESALLAASDDIERFRAEFCRFVGLNGETIVPKEPLPAEPPVMAPPPEDLWAPAAGEAAHAQ